MSEGRRLFISLLMSLALAAVITAQQTCNRTTGPAGVTDCVLLKTNYNAPQWAVCLTDAYIKQTSKGKHQCTDQTATYCWNQCMLETYGSMGPNVIGDCSCKLGSPAPGSTLPPRCLSPAGDDCSWYADCLEATYPCRGTSASYAINYGIEFCNLYTKNIGMFSTTGRQWVNAVRKCLQVTLVKFLRPFSSPTCQQISDTAFQSHAGCYLSPYPGVPSICSLPKSDFWAVFWTIKSSLVSQPFESLKGIYNVMSSCGRNIIDDSVRSIRIAIKNMSNATRKQRDVKIGDIDVDKATTSIAARLKWNNNDLDWLGMPANSTSADEFLIDILVTAKAALGSNGTMFLDEIVNGFSRAVKKGIAMHIDGSDLYVTKMNGCSTQTCESSSTTALAPPYESIMSTAKPEAEAGASITLGFACLAGLIVVQG